MIEEVGTVIDVQSQHGQQIIKIATQVKSTCGSCHAKDNCGTGVIARALANKRDALWLKCDEAVAIGQEVKLGVPEAMLLNASVLVYILPLFSLIGFAIVSSMLFTSEGWVILFSLLGATFSFLGVKRYIAKHSKGQFEPMLLAVLPSLKTKVDCIDVSMI
ncbi:SoxR reducing system RseC family protein [Paraglaciecola polaris]|mgnify:CR=1 FL=1|uniref:Sigma-E factor negative regulatory protein RseC n=1 Tax=Paraglaciecola polaris LMG 21857 TaxID=1129793 RepID=K6ZBQ6_9ALTE|nr:SoxR reducing system RseC family protein [Paraglaciecola polaris]GAC33546.1 sigma-E factor negative regulatory protein RseC [Paraglaciecola polaris LMG 21857]|tara:strand:+ start:727 stop:1209 length:483 start_codon:yes stop_codon:yes gene_type:complete